MRRTGAMDAIMQMRTAERSRRRQSTALACDDREEQQPLQPPPSAWRGRPWGTAQRWQARRSPALIARGLWRWIARLVRR